MKVLLLNPPYVPNFMRNARWATVGISGSVWFPIYLAYCTGLLEQRGHRVKLLDAQVDGMSHEETYQAAEEFKPELLVTYFSTVSEKNDLEVSEIIRERTGCEVILVGPWASVSPVRTLQSIPGIRFLAEGEFDFTVLELCEGRPPESIAGLYWKNSAGQVATNPTRPPVDAVALDSFPFVTDIYRRHLQISNYHQTGHHHPFVDLFSGRGCAWARCTFCLWPFTINRGAGYRKRSVENVIKELQFIRDRMPYIKEVFFQDDTLPRDRAQELSNAILENNLQLTWSCYSRANLDFETLKLMKKAGCRTMHVGYESSSPVILKNIQKGTSPEKMVKFTRDARKAGLYIVADFITGLPGETVETIKATVRWARRLPVQRYTVTLPKPYPRTPLYQLLAQNNWLDDQGRVSYPHLPYQEIREWNKWSLKKIYLNPRYLFRMAFCPSEWFRLLRSAYYFFPYLIKKRHPYQ